LEAVSVEQVFALLMCLHAALRTADALSREAPQQTLTLEAVRRRRRAPDDEVVRCRRGNGVDERLQCLLVDVLLLRHTNENFSSTAPSDNVALITTSIKSNKSSFPTTPYIQRLASLFPISIAAVPLYSVYLCVSVCALVCFFSACCYYCFFLIVVFTYSAL